MRLSVFAQKRRAGAGLHQLVMSAVFAACSLHAGAEVVESLTFTPYQVTVAPDGNLLAAINAATPIHEGKQIFHGYTDWQIAWRFYWHKNPNGSCHITSSKTTVSAHITLPELVSGNQSAAARFKTYILALRAHELGHFSYAKDAAQAIDRGILTLPAMANCESLNAAANALGHQLLEEAKTQEKQYDIVTQHGKTQGAWLPR